VPAQAPSASSATTHARAPAGVNRRCSAIVPWSIASRISPRPTVLLLCRGDAPQAVGALHDATQKINPEQTLGTRLEDVAEGDHKRVLLRAQNTV
jgi:hypothetical protein